MTDSILRPILKFRLKGRDGPVRLIFRNAIRNSGLLTRHFGALDFESERKLCRINTVGFEELKKVISFLEYHSNDIELVLDWYIRVSSGRVDLPDLFLLTYEDELKFLKEAAIIMEIPMLIHLCDWRARVPQFDAPQGKSVLASIPEEDENSTYDTENKIITGQKRNYYKPILLTLLVTFFVSTYHVGFKTSVI